VFEILVGRQARHIHAIARHIELPAVIDAAQAALLVAAEKQRRAAVRTAMVHDADAAIRVAEGNQFFAEQHQAHWRAIPFQLGRLGRRHPVAPHQVAHDGARTDAGQLNAFAGCGHGWSLTRRSE
jgi:hypothetical protein